MKLGIYMGSFNPPHKGHLKVVNYLLEKHYVDKVLIVPTLNYWDKQHLVDIDDRINMLKFFENDNIIIDTTHNACIYTIDLLKELKKEYLDTKFVLIMGADNLVNLDKWKNYQELLKYPILVMNRNHIDGASYLKKLGKNKIKLINNYPFIDISSSSILKEKRYEYLERRVINYIKERHLYEE